MPVKPPQKPNPTRGSAPPRALIGRADSQPSFLSRRVARLVQDSLQTAPVREIDRQDCPPPEGFVALGLLQSPIGLKGAIRVKSLHPGGDQPSALMGLQEAFVRAENQRFYAVTVTSIEAHGKDFRMQIVDIETLEEAALFMRAQIGLPREALPAPASDEAYWTDLVGCRVTNREGLVLGTIDSMDTNGAHDWLIVGRHWIPYVDAFIETVDTKAKTVTVDWQPDWS